jgi:hypothetical protein
VPTEITAEDLAFLLKELRVVTSPLWTHTALRPSATTAATLPLGPVDACNDS